MKSYFSLRKFVALISATMMVCSIGIPSVLAKSADSAVSVIEDKTDDADQVRRDSDAAIDLDTASEINNYFDELINLINDVESEIKAVTTPISQSDFDKVDNAYDDFMNEIDDAVNQADDLVTTTNQTTFDNNESELDDEVDDADDALDTLRSKITGSSTTGSTTSATVNSAISNINDAEDNVNDLATEASGIDNSSELNAFFDDLVNEASDVVDELKRITGSISATDLDNLQSAIDDFKDEADKQITRASDRIDVLNGQDAVATVTEITSASNMKVTVTTAGTGSFGSCPNISIGTSSSPGTHTFTSTSDITTATTSITVNTDVNGIAKGDVISVTDGTNTLHGTVLTVNSTTRVLTFSGLVQDAGSDIPSGATTKNLTVTTPSASIPSACSADSHFNSTGSGLSITLSTGDLTGIAVNDTIIVTMNASTSSTSLQNEFDNLEQDYRDNEEDDIDTQIDRISNLSTGTTSTSALVSSVISDIEDSEDDVNSLRDDSDTVDTVSELQDYFDDLINYINDVEDSLKRITGTITQSDFDNIADAVDSFQDEVKSARQDVEENSTSTSYTDEFDNLDDDLNDEMDSVDDALDTAESKIGVLNPPTRTTFYDVFASSEFAPYINALAARSVVNGYPDGSFRPKNNVTRAEFLKMAILAKGLNVAAYQSLASPFVDVPMSHSLRPYVNYAAANSIAVGQTINGLRYFYPERPITRAEAVIILMRISGIAPGTATTSRFVDVRDMEQIRYIEVAATRGIVRGYNASVFGPNDNLTREQAAKVVALTNGII